MILKSSLKSILWCFCLLIVYTIYETKDIISLAKPSGLFMFLTFFGGFYLVISFIGWLFIGFPWHWFLKKFTYKSYFLYAFPSLMFIAGSIVSKQYEIGFVYGFFSLVQALIFRYYIYKQI